jgi:CRP-like cAMP-binding protein
MTIDVETVRSASAAMDLLIRSLEHRDTLSHEERALLRGLPMRVQSFHKGEDIVAEHSRPTESCLIMEGLAVRVFQMADGKRQVTAVHMPGDFVDLHGLLLKVMDHGVSAMSDCRAVFTPHRAVVEIVERAPHLGRLLWMSTVIDGAIQRAWIGCLGRRSATAHFGHLICEMYLRFEAVGLARDHRMAFAFTQTEMADILALSSVHVNRITQELRRAGLIVWERGKMVIPDFDRLAAFSAFDPTYLNLFREPR